MDPLRHVKPAVRALARLHARPRARPRSRSTRTRTRGTCRRRVKRRVLEKALARPWSRYPDFDPKELLEALARFSGWRADGILAGNGSNEADRGPAPGHGRRRHEGRHPRADVHPVRAHDHDPRRRAGAGADGCDSAEDATGSGGRGTRRSLQLRGVSERSGAPARRDPRRVDFAYDVEALLAARRASAGAGHDRLLARTTPPAPCLALADVERLCGESDGLVVIDEAYHEFSGRTVVPLLERHPNLVVLRTFSKAMALAGLRVGYLLASPELVREVNKARLPYNLNFFSQAAAPRGPRGEGRARHQRPPAGRRARAAPRAARGRPRRAGLPLRRELLPARVPVRGPEGGLRPRCSGGGCSCAT